MCHFIYQPIYDLQNVREVYLTVLHLVVPLSSNLASVSLSVCSKYWPLFLLFFYILCPIPYCISRRVVDDTDSASNACKELAIFLTTGIVISAFGLPIVFARAEVVSTRRFLLRPEERAHVSSPIKAAHLTHSFKLLATLPSFVLIVAMWLRIKATAVAELFDSVDGLYFSVKEKEKHVRSQSNEMSRNILKTTFYVIVIMMFQLRKLG